MKSETRTELMAIPIVAIVFVARHHPPHCIGGRRMGLGSDRRRRPRPARASSPSHYSRRNPHPRSLVAGARGARSSQPADDTYRVLVIADESCVDPGFPAQLAAHASGRTIEALVIAPAIGSWLARWTSDESAHVDARKHLDDTVTALARAGITAMGETGADDPIQATDDGLREFAANEIVFVTKPGTDTDWVEEGVIETATKRYAIPVTHIALAAA